MALSAEENQARTDARMAVYRAIIEFAPGSSPENLQALAEAYKAVTVPGAPG